MFYTLAIVVFIILLVYKLEGKTDLSWKWITLPLGCLLIPSILLAMVVIGLFAGGLFCAIFG